MGQPGNVVLTVEHDGSVEAIAFSPDSALFASGGGDAVMRVRTVGTGPSLDVASEGFVSSIAFSPEGTTFAVADFEQVHVRNSSDGTVVWSGPIEPGTSVNFVRFTPDGRTLVAATDMVVALFDSMTGEPGLRITVERPLIADLDVSSDGARIALAIDERHGGNHHRAGSARVLELATGEELGRLTPDDAVFAVAFSPDGSLVLCCAADDTVRMFEADGGAQLWPAEDEIDDEITAASFVAFDPRGRWTVVGGADGFSRILEAESGVERGRAPKLDPGLPDPGFGAVTHVAFAPNGKAAASASIDNVVRLFNLDGKELYAVSTDEVFAMAFSPDGRWLGLGCRGRAVVIDNGDFGVVG
jgi:WD40 repeat protein